MSLSCVPICRKFGGVKSRRNQEKKIPYGVQMLKAYLPDLTNEPSYHVVDLLVDSLVYQDGI